MTEEKKEEKQQKQRVSKAYEQYTRQFTPKPTYYKNSMKAFLIGGAVCLSAKLLQDFIVGNGMDEKTAGIYVTILLVMAAQLLTGLGLFDTIGKFAGAGVIVPITGFANSMVAPAIEYKKEGIILGVGAKLFSLAGPVLVSGIFTATVVGMVYWIIEQL